VNVASCWVDATIGALRPLADSERAAAMAAYMKDVSPFLGISSTDRRAAQRQAWRDCPALASHEVADVSLRLWALPEREFQYAACDLVHRQVRRLPAEFVVDPVQRLLTDRPWWDTVDSLGTVAISPLTAAYPQLLDTMWIWWESGDRWLVRAAIQHQRGRGERTDLDVLFTMCDRYADEREFFIAKAIGWALRDVTRWNAPAVQRFVDEHPGLSTVARREARRGLDRARASGAG
jgi:3-methyladenine DNA glycosylase AlkD